MATTGLGSLYKYASRLPESSELSAFHAITKQMVITRSRQYNGFYAANYFRAEAELGSVVRMIEVGAHHVGVAERSPSKLANFPFDNC